MKLWYSNTMTQLIILSVKIKDGYLNIKMETIEEIIKFQNEIEKMTELNIKSEIGQTKQMLEACRALTNIDFNYFKKQIESNEAGVHMAEKANDIMQKSFKIGAASFIQLRDTEDALMAARLAYFQAIYNYLVAESDLEFVLGNTHYVRN